MSVYDFTYKNLGHTHTGTSTAAEMGEYSPHKKGMELERDYLLTLSSINLLISLENHEIFNIESH